MSSQRGPGGRAFWILTAIGVALIGFGLAGLLRNAEETVPASWLTYFAGGLIASDLVVLPVVALAGAAVVRLVPRAARAPVQGALLVSAALVLVAIPVLSGRGRNPNNRSVLPDGNYADDLALALAVVWAVTAVLVAVRVRARRGGGDGPAAHQ